MTMRLSFCMQAIKTLGDRDINALTAGIETYVTGGMETAAAERAAVNDLLAEVKADRAEVVRLADEQHPKLKIDAGAVDLDTSQGETTATAADKAAVNVLQGIMQRHIPGLVLDAVAPPVRDANGNLPRGADRSLAAAADLAKRLFDKRVVIFTSNKPFANGVQLDNQPGVIYVSANSKAHRPAMAVIGHELLHSLRQDRPDLYRELEMRLSKLLRNPGEYGEKLNAKYRAAGLGELNAESLREELIADIVGDQWTDPDFWAELGKGQPTGFKKVLDAVLSFLDDVIGSLADIRPFGTGQYLTDLKAARTAVADALRNYSAGEVGPSVSSDNLRMSMERPTEPFYSELSRQVGGLNMKAGSADAWKQAIKGLASKGVKAEEVAWTGLDEWLELQTGKVTKDQVLDYLNANGVQVQETTLGGSAGIPEKLSTWLEENGYDTPGDAAAWLQISDSSESRAKQLQRDGRRRESKENFEIAELANEMAERMETDSGKEFGVTKYGRYTLPGGKNYREVLLTLPAKDTITTDRVQVPAGWGDTDGGNIGIQRRKNTGADYRSGHWDQAKVLAHIRLNDRTDAEGKRVLFVEEVQSDWGQSGKKRGFKEGSMPARDALTAYEKGLKDRYDDWMVGQLTPGGQESTDKFTPNMRLGDIARAIGEGDKHLNLFQNMERERGEDSKRVPAAPFVGRTDAWVSLALKRVIKMAVDEGYDRVAFVNGEQSADRYDLSKQIGGVEYFDNHSGGVGRAELAGEPSAGTLIARDLNGHTVIEKRVEPDEVEDYVGKEVAKRLFESEPMPSSRAGINARQRRLRGLDLKVGGEGMKTFYDKIVPTVLKDVLKKTGGGKLVDVRVGSESDHGKVVGGQAVYRPEGERSTVESTQLGFDVTDAMRQKAAGGMPLFSIAEPVQGGIRGFNQTAARNLFLDMTDNAGKLGFWGRTIGTQYAKAQKNPTTFGRVFDAVQDYIKDINLFANSAADMAPTILPKLENWLDLKKGGLLRHGADPVDLKAAGSAAFQGTLSWSRDAGGKLVPVDEIRAAAEKLTVDAKSKLLIRGNRLSDQVLKMWQGLPVDRYEKLVTDKFDREFLKPGVVFTTPELRKMGLTGPQIDLYREFRAAVDQSLTDLAKSEMVRMAGTDGDAVAAQVMAADSLTDAAAVLREHFDKLGTATPDRKESLDKTYEAIADKSTQVDRLKHEGYAPLMRFGRHTLHIKRGDETEFFGMYESRREANKAAREMQSDPQFKGAQFSRGMMSQEAYKLYAGIPLDALELFAQTTGNEQSEVYQDFLRLTKNNRSALKRMIHRQGIAGFSEDTARVLASFVTSNARMASGNRNLSRAKKAADEIPKELGDLKDDAVKLVQYAQDPQEEAAGLRGLLFTNFIGGSVASAAVNLTQPLTMTLPYLSQFGGVAKATQHLMAAAKTVAAGKPTGEIGEALARAEKDGIVSPQEIHHLQAEAMNRLGNHPVLKKAAFIWGSLFSLSEQFNRRVSFVAAYNMAKQTHVEDPFAFAEKAVIETQGLYNKGNKPNWARGPIGSTVFTFRQFSIHYLEFLERMWHSGPQGKRAVGVALAVLVMVAGAGGLPFADDLDDAVDTLAQALGYDFSSKAAKRKFVADTLGLGNVGADVATRGLSSLPGFPIDVSLRMGMGNLLPGTGALLRSNTDRSRDVLEFAGAAGGLAKNAMDAGGKLLSGEVAQAGLTMAPVAIRNMAQAMTMWNTSEYRNSRDQKIMDTGPLDAVAKGLGFQPAEVARESAAVQTLQRSIQLARNIESEIASKWASGLKDGDAAKVQEARAELAEWNEKNPSTPMRIRMQDVIQRVRQMRMSREDRTIKAAPAELRQKVREAL